jgi:hypothetical protein
MSQKHGKPQKNGKKFPRNKIFSKEFLLKTFQDSTGIKKYLRLMLLSSIRIFVITLRFSRPCDDFKNDLYVGKLFAGEFEEWAPGRKAGSAGIFPTCAPLVVVSGT